MGTHVIHCFNWNWEYYDRDVPQKKLLYALQGGKCRKCWHEFHIDSITIDHILARIDGGTQEFMNKQLLCKKCHINKTHSENRERARKKKIVECMIVNNDSYNEMLVTSIF